MLRKLLYILLFLTILDRCSAQFGGAGMNQKTLTKFGVFVFGLDNATQISVTNSLDVQYVRNNMNMDSYTGSIPNWNNWTAAGKLQVLNINYLPTNTGAQPFATDTVAYKTTLNSILTSYRPEVCVIENEETNQNLHSGTMAQYLNQLRAATTVVHSKGLTLTNGGIHPEGVCYWVWKDLVSRGLTAQAAAWQNLTFSTIMKNAANNPGSNAGFDLYWRKIDTLLTGYTTIPIDYVNMHIYEPINGVGNGSQTLASCITTMADYIRHRTGKPVMSNEYGQDNGTADGIVPSMMQAAAAADFAYCIWYSGDGTSAYALNNSDGSIRSNGLRYKSWIDLYNPVSNEALNKPVVFLSQTEMTPSGGQVYDEFYWLNSSNASLTSPSQSFLSDGSYRVDFSAYKVAGNPSVNVLIDGSVKGAVAVNSATPAIFSLYISNLTAGSHTVKLQLANFSSGANHARIGLLYVTKTKSQVPYTYPSITPQSLVWGQILRKEHFGSGVLRGFSLGSNGTNQPGEPVTSMTAMRATGANIVRCFVEIERPSGDTYQFKSGELEKLDTTIARGSRLGFYVVPVIFHDPSLNSDYWGTTASHIARRLSIANLWKTLAQRYVGNATVAAYDLINEPRSNFNYAEVIRWQMQMIDSIRTIDANHVCMIECISNDMFAMMLPVPYTNIVYSPHGYSTTKITHQGVTGESSATVRNKYPTVTSTSNLTAPWNITQLSAQHDDVRTMSHRFRVPVFIGEFSCVHWAPKNDNGEWTSTKWVSDNISLLEAEGWSWVYHNWNRGGEAIEWDPEIDPAFYNSVSFTSARPATIASWTQHSDTAPTIVMLKSYFSLNPNP